MHRTHDQWLALYGSTEVAADWRHDGNPNRPHVILRSGLHSGRYFNNDQMMQFATYVHEASEDLVEKIASAGLDLMTVDRVVGPAMGAIVLADAVALAISQKTGRLAKSGYGQKHGSGDDFTFVIDRCDIRPGERILRVEDVVTKGGSVGKLKAAIESMGAATLPFIGILVNRSAETVIGDARVVSLLDMHAQVEQWPAGDCPLCRAGSPIEKDVKKNWRKTLFAEYPVPTVSLT